MSQVHNAVFNTLGAVDSWMKTISQNITGSTVTGYRGQQVEFGEVLNMQVRGGAKPTDGYGSVNPIQRGDSGIRITGIRTDFSQGSITQTNEPTHLAISGDAFFVLSRVPVPRSMDDLVFTRDGSFHFENIEGPVAGTGTNRLVNKDGFFVMGYNTPVGAGRPFATAPEESSGTDINAFATVVADAANPQGIPVQMQNMQLDQVRNPNLNGFGFTPQGMVQIAGQPPRDLANNEANMHVTLVKFANAQGLSRQGGGSYFKYDVVAGQMVAGTASDGRPGKIIGRDNTLTAGAIEAANTSINTVMPELTLAQKSFSAASKIISVGNTMIDDVNGLVR